MEEASALVMEVLNIPVLLQLCWLVHYFIRITVRRLTTVELILLQRTAEESRATEPLQKFLVGNFQDSSSNATQ